MKKDKNTIGGMQSHAHNAPDSGIDSPFDWGELDGANRIDAKLLGKLIAGSAGSISAEETPVAVKKLFTDRERTFWTFQIVGWVGYLMVRMFQGLTMGMEVGPYLQLAFVATLIGFAFSMAMRLIYRRVRDEGLPVVLGVSFVVSALAGLLQSSIETSVAPYIFSDFSIPYGLQRFGNAMFDSTALFAWTALYFGYHFYASSVTTQEQVLKANAMAHQAQLKMLRYQLNPHFLFNTLNAISTLVLEKATSEANEMLTKLSAFLRYTLDNQPNQRIPLDQELYALGLYLDIEKVRFDSRLRINYEIDDRVRQALIPSLILQPLIENAIKYAIGPSIEGGALTVRAGIRHHRLVLQLLDDGPGIEDLSDIKSQNGGGVGLVNTRERLNKIYRDQHEFLIENRDEGGLSITMIMPLEKPETAPE